MKDTACPSGVFTICFGLVCAMAFIPLSACLTMVLYWSRAFSFSLWLFIAVYCIILSRVSRTPMRYVLLPLILLLLAVASTISCTAVILFCTFTLSFLRTGLCFTGLGQFGVECLVFVFGTAALICFAPHTVFTWALSIWLFFLIQAFYPFLIDLRRQKDAQSSIHDFAQAERDVTRLLSELHQSMTR